MQPRKGADSRKRDRGGLSPFWNERNSLSDKVDQFGSNAVPGLLKWLRYETPLWKVQLYRLNPMLRPVKPSWIINEESDELQIRGAARALQRLRRVRVALALVVVSQLSSRSTSKRREANFRF